MKFTVSYSIVAGEGQTRQRMEDTDQVEAESAQEAESQVRSFLIERHGASTRFDELQVVGAVVPVDRDSIKRVNLTGRY